MEKIKRCSLLIGITLILFGCSRGASFTKEQAMIKKGYELIKDALLDPDSIIVYDCYGWGAKSEAQMLAKYSQKDSDEELPDDQYVTYYHIGAKNTMGGISEETYIIIFDPENGDYIAAGEKSDYDAFVNGDKSIDIDHEVQGQFLNALFWDAMGGWGENQTDYKDFISSKEFEKLDVEKILKNE